MSKVLFINEKVSFISEGIINHLRAQDFEVLTVKPDVTAIANFLKDDNGSDEEAIDPEVAALLSQESEKAEGEEGGGEKAEEGEKKDIKNYTVKVHALKSAARLVGALDLSADAKHLEESGDNNDVHEIEQKTPKLLAKYRAYKPVLAKVFGGGEEDESLPEISLDDLHEMYS